MSRAGGAPPTKEAVVFILDANPSMNHPYPSRVLVPPSTAKASVKIEEHDDNSTGRSGTLPGPSSTTRLDCAKQALISMISSLMVQTKTNEVAVIVCKTAKTQHHKIAAHVDVEQEYGNDVPFPNLTELTDGLVRPDIDLLRRIAHVASVDESTVVAAEELRGDLCDAIVLAADVHYEYGRNTSGKTLKRFRRKIVLITDAEHQVIMDTRQTLIVVDTLRNMGCTLEVIGLDFVESMEFNEPLAAERAVKQEDMDAAAVPWKKVKMEDTVAEVVKQEDDSSKTDVDAASDYEGNVESESEERIYSSKEDRIELLAKLTEMTGGKVVAASTLQEILDSNKGKRVTRSVLNKFEFRIAPGVAVEARSALMMQAVSFSSAFGKIDEKAVVIDPDTNQPALDEQGNEIVEEIIKTFNFVEDDRPDVFVSKNDVAYADLYGSSLIPISEFDREGLKVAEEKPYLQILGYMKREKVPSLYVSGDPVVITGHESLKACAAISAIAQALDRKDKVAIGTFLKRTNASKKNLVALYPLSEPEYPHPMRLVCMEIPYGEEVKHITLDSLDELLHGEHESVKAKVCDDFIDSLMLPDGALGSGETPSPLVRSCNQTKLERALDHNAPVVTVRPSDDDRMVTPVEVLRRAQTAIQAFEEHFPLEMKKNDKKVNKGEKGRTVLTYKNSLK